MDGTIKRVKTDFSKNLWRTYNWFSATFTSKIRELISDFWGLDFELKLFAIGENSNVLFKGDKYFVTQIKVTKNLSVGVRLSQSAIRSILDEALGRSEKPFRMEDLSELEVKIITSFNDYLYNGIQKILIPVEKIDKNAVEDSLCHMVFYLSVKGRDFGKLVLSIPTNLIEPELVKCEQEKFSIANFKTSKTDVRIKVGSSKIKLGEVKSLQVEDIVLLENSNIYKMKICNEGREIEFNISPDPSIILNTDNEGEEMEDNTQSVSNLWDNIQVDINAEFEKVQISLGELKQISEGLVVDIGSIYDNRIDLRVENKLVAKGELVIINDRYGVRIDEVIKDEVPPQPTKDAAPEHSTTAQEKLEEEEFEDEDFNYDDFDEESEI